MSFWNKLLGRKPPPAEDLINAARDGDLAKVQVRIAKGANVNASDSEGDTALMLASSNGHDDVVKALLVKRADVNARSANGWTALIAASGNDHVGVVQALLAKRANVNSIMRDGGTALTAATTNGCAGVVRKLLSNGADFSLGVDHGNGRTMTPLKLAQIQENTAIIDLLVKAGARK